MAEPVRVIRAADLVAADPTSGMLRHRAFEVPLLWAGHVETAPGAISGWHHHDCNETSLYFVHVPALTIHRESDPTDEPSLAVIARAGGGIPTVNVEEPPGQASGARSL